MEEGDDGDHDEEDHRIRGLVGELAAGEPAAEDQQGDRLGGGAGAAIGEGDDLEKELAYVGV